MVTNYKKRKRLPDDLDEQLRSLDINLTVVEVCKMYRHLDEAAVRARVKKLGLKFKTKADATEERRRALVAFVKPNMTFPEIARKFPHINKASLLNLLYNHQIPFKSYEAPLKKEKEPEFFEHDPYYKF